MFTLPRDVLKEIQEYIHISQQPSLRRVSKQMSSIPFDWQKQCCFPPTIYEIANFLMDMKKDLLKKNPWPMHLSPRSETDFIYIYVHDLNENGYEFETYSSISFNKITGEIRHTGVNLTSREAIINSIRNNILHMSSTDSSSYIENLKIIRLCLHRRHKCIEHGFNPDKCFIKLCISYLSEYYIEPKTLPFYNPRKFTKTDSYENIFLILKSILKPEKLTELDLDFQKTFKITTLIGLTDYFSENLHDMFSEISLIPIENFRLWLISSISELQTSDLLPIV